MREVYIGVDPGSKGYMCVHDIHGYRHIPLRESAGAKGINKEVIDALRDASTHDCFVVVEHVHAMHGQGVTSTFTFGQNFGMILGIIIAFGIPYELVTPQKWQKAMVTPSDRTDNTKQSSYNAAHRLHQDMDFRRTSRSKTWDDNKVDATLICDYAIRNNY